jgi:hypothetical protein
MVKDARGCLERKANAKFLNTAFDMLCIGGFAQKPISIN